MLLIECLLVRVESDLHADRTACRDMILVSAKVRDELRDVARAFEFAHQPDEDLAMRG